MFKFKSLHTFFYHLIIAISNFSAHVLTVYIFFKYKVMVYLCFNFCEAKLFKTVILIFKAKNVYDVIILSIKKYGYKMFNID